MTPFTLEERLMHVAEAKRTLGTEIPWICDTMDNDLKHAFGDAPNSEYVIDPDGVVVRWRSWSDPEQLRADLEELIGPVENPTRVEDLDLATAPAPREAPSGIVPGVDRPMGASALRVESVTSDDDEPFYVKLRAEAGRDVLSSGDGQLYLGFHLDPLYHVHWNNLVEPIRVEITAPDGATFAPASLGGPEVEAEADIDPREFLVDVSGMNPGDSFEIAVHYFACNDEAGWCKPVSQRYIVAFEVDRDGGRARSARGARGARGGRGGRDPGGRGLRGPGRPGGGGFGDRGGTRLMGQLVSVDVEARTIVVQMPDGGETTYRIADDAMIMRGRQARATLDDLTLGAVVQFMTEETEDGPVIVRMMLRPGR